MDSNNKNVDFISKGQNQMKVDDAVQAKNILLKTAFSSDDMPNSIAATVYKATMVNPTKNNDSIMRARRICFDLDQE
jgi:hypothetical protein